MFAIKTNLSENRTEIKKKAGVMLTHLEQKPSKYDYGVDKKIVFKGKS